MSKKHCSCAMCPSKVEGAETTVTNTDTGVTVVITAKDPASVKKIQELAAKHFAKEDGKAAKGAKAEKWVCPMGCGESDKPGKCPKCGMEMIKKK